MFKIDSVIVKIVNFKSVFLLAFYMNNFGDIFKEVLVSACHVIKNLLLI